ncbi:neutral zinc metallopeptidase [Suttonella sp. R2A3]|uniref:KPN_02809 family neutral zinc metallopeptidase n=1 Tax=Suttonella sp. R2A3 TaxID=2908648 RepID=UPI001F3D1646|nr:neutral zinc metallopeptidase [Suttonella sp. R2A3]UJF25398.1 neutral zinc metallopeptidase [Suttonella sp. R2A3]
MRWKQGRRSGRVSDRRGKGAAVGGIGLTGIIIVLVGWFMGVDPRMMLGLVDAGSSMLGGSSSTTDKPPAEDDEIAQFISVVFASNQDVWDKQLARYGERYQQASAVIFDGNVQTACGINSQAVGPFYCPGDKTVYLPPSFINDLRRLGGAGDFAFAYVIAHEVGHHVQNLLQTLPQAHQAMRGRSKSEANAISVALELQADCYAGIWANHVERTSDIQLEAGDLQEGLRAAAAVGDDSIMQDAGRSVHPESFTHGSAEQRQYWLNQGIRYGSIERCDTFSQL